MKLLRPYTQPYLVEAAMNKLGNIVLESNSIVNGVSGHKNSLILLLLLLLLVPLLTFPSPPQAHVPPTPIVSFLLPISILAYILFVPSSIFSSCSFSCCDFSCSFFHFLLLLFSFPLVSSFLLSPFSFPVSSSLYCFAFFLTFFVCVFLPSFPSAARLLISPFCRRVNKCLLNHCIGLLD